MTNHWWPASVETLGFLVSIWTFASGHVCNFNEGEIIMLLPEFIPYLFSLLFYTSIFVSGITICQVASCLKTFCRPASTSTKDANQVLLSIKIWSQNCYILAFWRKISPIQIVRKWHQNSSVSYNHIIWFCFTIW